MNTNELNNAVGVSIIPTDISYSDDGSISVDRCIILSVTEIDKNNSRNPTRLISAPEEFREKAYSDSNSKLQGKTINQDMKALRNKREKLSIKKDTKSQAAYQKQIEIFKNANIYKIEMLKQVLTSLTSQAQSQKNPEIKKLIEQEIKFVQNEIEYREKNKNTELTSGITIAKSVRNDDGTLTVNPIITVEQPKALVDTRSGLEKHLHLAKSSIDNFFSDIKSKLSKLTAKPNKETPKKRSAKHQAVKSKPPEAVRTVKPDIPKTVQEQKKEPLFSISQIKSDKYYPTSSKDKNVDRTKKNDLDL